MKIRKCDICGYECKDNGFTYEPNMGYKIKITDLGDHWDTDTGFEKFYVCRACGKKLQDYIREWGGFKELVNGIKNFFKSEEILRKEQTGENTRNQTTSSSDVSGTKMEGTSVENAEQSGLCDLEEAFADFIGLLNRLSEISEMLNPGTEKKGGIQPADDLGLDDE